MYVRLIIILEPSGWFDCDLPCQCWFSHIYLTAIIHTIPGKERRDVFSAERVK